MKIEISKLINPLILNDEWEKFQGDSEYTDENGKLIYGSWILKKVIGKHMLYANEESGVFELEDKIEVPLEHKSICFIRNKKGNICMVQLNYDYDNGDNMNES